MDCPTACALLPSVSAPSVSFRPFSVRFAPVFRPFLRFACVVLFVAFVLRAFTSRLRRFFARLDKIYGFDFFARLRAIYESVLTFRPSIRPDPCPRPYYARASTGVYYPPYLRKKFFSLLRGKILWENRRF